MRTYISFFKKAKNKKRLFSLAMTVVLLSNSFLFALPRQATAETQNAYRWRNDDGTEVTATWAAAENTSATIAKGVTSRLRMGVTNSGAETEFTNSTVNISGTYGEGTSVVVLVDETTTPNYAYVATYSEPAWLIKVRLDTYERVAAIPLGSGEDYVWSGVIDTTNGYIYLGTSTSPGRVVKVRLSDFTQVDSLTLQAGENDLRSAAISSDGSAVFFGTYTSPGRVVEIQTSDLTRTGAETLDSGDNNLHSATYDGTYAYFGTNTAPGRIVRVQMSDITTHSTMTLNSGVGEDYLLSAAIDTTGATDYAYFGTYTDPGNIIKVDLSTFALIDITKLTLSGGTTISNLTTSGIDTTNDYIYYTGTDSFGFTGYVAQVDLSTFTYAASHSSFTYTFESLGVEASTGDVFVGAYSVQDSYLMKIDESTMTEADKTRIYWDYEDSPWDIEDDGTYLYYNFFSYNYSEIIKVRKSDMTYVGKFVTDDIYSTRDLSLDLDNGIAYVGGLDTATNDAAMVRVNLSTMLQIGSPLVIASACDFGAVEVDSTAGYVYAASWCTGTGGGDGGAYKISISSFTVDTALEDIFPSFVYGSAIDTANGFLYLYDEDVPGNVFKFDLSNFSGGIDDTYTMNVASGESEDEQIYNYGGGKGFVINSAGTYGYIGTTEPTTGDSSKIVQIQLSDMTRIGEADMSATEFGVNISGLDEDNGYLYLHVEDYNGSYFSDARLVRVTLSPLARDAAYESTPGSANGVLASTVDPAAGYIYGDLSAGGGTATEYLRVSIAPKADLQLEYGQKLTSCAAASYTAVPVTPGASEHWQISDSSNLTDGAVTTNVAGGVSDGNTNFNRGFVVDASATTSEVSYGIGQFTEVEFAIEATNDALETDYCFRLTDGGAPAGFTYTSYAEATVGVSAPGLWASTGRTTYNRPHLDRLKAGLDNIHFTLSFQLAGTSGASDTLSIVFPSGFANVDASGASATCSGGGTMSNWQDDGDRNAWADKSSCAGTVEVEGIYVDLPDAVGSYIIEWSNDNGSGAVSIVDDDQVTVTSNVDPSLQFDIDTSTTTSADTAAPYTVDFGTLDVSQTNVSGEATINYIMVDLSTNATSGAIVTIENANGASGLVSTSTPSDTVANAAGTMATGTENYGFCVQYTNQTLGQSFSKAGNYTSGTCADQADGNAVKGLSTSAANIFSVSGPVSGGRAVISGSAAIDSLTPAHDDYTDTLKFIATATF